MPTEDNLQEIYIKAKQGDISSEKHLFQYLLVRFTAIAKQRLREDYSEDIAQDACLTVLEKYKKLSPQVAFVPWAYKILRNKIGSYMRDTSLRNSRLHYSGNIELMSTSYYSVENPELKYTIIRCLKKLSKSYGKYFTIINLKNNGYTTKEICEKMKINANHLYVMLHRCRAILYACIYNDEGK